MATSVTVPDAIVGKSSSITAEMNEKSNVDLVPELLEPEAIHPLPPPPANLAGSCSATGKNYNVTVTNKAGYLCHVYVETSWPVPPEVPFAIFTHPDNSALFRDVKRVGTRKVVKTEPGYKEVQVEQLGEVKILWIKRTYSTWLHVTEDTRDPECLRITFELDNSDVLGRFNGRWELRQIRDAATGKVVGCRGELNQDVLPKGMPSFMARLPVLGGVLRGISVGVVTRVMDDFNVSLEKVIAGHAAGRSTEAVLRELCGPVSEAAHANGAVNSFAFNTDEGEDEDDEEEEKGIKLGNQDEDMQQGRAAKTSASKQSEAGGEPDPARGEAEPPLPSALEPEEQQSMPPSLKVEPDETGATPKETSVATACQDEADNTAVRMATVAIGSGSG